MEEQKNLFTLVDEYKELLDKKDSLKEETKENNEKIEILERKISNMMIDEECTTISRNGFKYSLQTKTCYTKKSEESLADAGLVFFDVLRENGLGDIIVETVNARTLQSTLSAIVSEQGALPEVLDEVINTYEKIGIGKRKERTVKK